MSLATATCEHTYDGYELVATSPAVGIGYDAVASWSDELAFQANVRQWLDDSLFDSLPHRMKAHASYKAIIAQGEKVVPLVAGELRRKPTFLFLVLEDLTGADPVSEESYGDLRATVEAWLAWLQR